MDTLIVCTVYIILTSRWREKQIQASASRNVWLARRIRIEKWYNFLLIESWLAAWGCLKTVRCCWRRSSVQPQLLFAEAGANGKLGRSTLVRTSQQLKHLFLVSILNPQSQSAPERTQRCRKSWLYAPSSAVSINISKIFDSTLIAPRKHRYHLRHQFRAPVSSRLQCWHWSLDCRSWSWLWSRYPFRQNLPSWPRHHSRGCIQGPVEAYSHQSQQQWSPYLPALDPLKGSLAISPVDGWTLAHVIPGPLRGSLRRHDTWTGSPMYCSISL